MAIKTLKKVSIIGLLIIVGITVLVAYQVELSGNGSQENIAITSEEVVLNSNINGLPETEAVNPSKNVDEISGEGDNTDEFTEYFPAKDTSYMFNGKITAALSNSFYEVTLLSKYQPTVRINVPIKARSEVEGLIEGRVYRITIHYDDQENNYVITEAKNNTIYD
jgi:hypothetical protein